MSAKGKKMNNNGNKNKKKGKEKIGIDEFHSVTKL